MRTRVAALVLAPLTAAGFLIAAAPTAHAATPGQWVYYDLDGSMTLPAVEAELSTWITSVDPSFPTQFQTLDIQGGFLAYQPTSLGVSGFAYESLAGTLCATTDLNSSGVSRFARVLPGAPPSVFDPTTDPYSAYSAARNMHADAFWKAGLRGSGIDVAVVDTGISPVGSGGVAYPAPLGQVSGLDDANAIVNGPDFSFESQSPDLTHLDGFGHGTAMAGIIHTLAPDARLINLKVGDATGAADVTQVIAAIDWAREHRNKYGLNIRVINLSYGVVSANSWQTDELSKAVDRAWQDGIVVVVAGGNSVDGNFVSGLTSPAYNKSVLAVSAVDSGTNATTVKDDTQTTFALTQGANSRLPDLATPGAHITSFRVPNAQADFAVANELCGLSPIGKTSTAGDPNYTYPIWTDAVGRTWIRGSGTSQAAALASGAVALVLSKWPTLKPDEVKKLLRDNAATVPNGTRNDYGAGEIDLGATLAGKPTIGWTYSYGTVTGGDPIENSRGGYHLFDETATTRNVTGCVFPANYSVPPGQPLCGEKDIFGTPFNTKTHATLANSDATWTDAGVVSTPNGPVTAGVWNGDAMIAAPAANAAGQKVGFVTDPNTGQLTWPSQQWFPTTNWAGSSLQWNTNWVGSRWVGSRWVGSRWVDGGWSGSRWVGSRWVGSRWVADGWSSAGWR